MGFFSKKQQAEPAPWENMRPGKVKEIAELMAAEDRSAHRGNVWENQRDMQALAAAKRDATEYEIEAGELDYHNRNRKH